MNITFLIGNGFDIGMGMRSAFRDFFPIYQVKSIDKVSRIRRLSQEIGADYETWADFESALGKYTLNFTPETKQDFIDQLKDFEKDFIDYLKGQKEMLSFDTFKSISDMMVDALIGYYNNGNLAYESKLAISRIYSQHAAENHVYNFVNFNYTDVLEQCLATIPQQIVCKRKYNGVERIDKLGRTVHIHGTCDFQPIIGVNDISQIANQELAKDSRFTSFIVKPSLNQLMRLGNDGATQTLINQSAIICIYGMSLGSTDRKWWSNILSWLHSNGERQLVIFNYDKQYSPSNQFDWLEKENGFIDMLSSYSNDIEVEKLRSRIHIAVHKNIFEMDLVKQHREMCDLAVEKVLAEV